MSGYLSFDTGAASRAADRWVAWANSVDDARHALAWDLDRLQLGDLGADACRHLGHAGSGLIASATFVRQLTQTISEADWLGAYDQRRIESLWGIAEELAGRWSFGRSARAHDRAVLGWLRGQDAATVRDHFDDGDLDPAVVLDGLHGERSVLYWDALSAAQQAALAATRPDLVVTRLLAAGVGLSPEVVSVLREHNDHLVSSLTSTAEFEITIGQVIQFELGGGLSVVLSKHRSGAVELLLFERIHGGGGHGVLGVADAAWRVGAEAGFQQKFSFADEAEALDAIGTLLAAAAQDGSFGELLRDLRNGVRNVGTIQLNAWAETPCDLVGLVLVGFASCDVPDIPLADMTPEMTRALAALWTTHGFERVEGVGAYASLGAEFGVDLDALRLEIDASARASIMLYDQTAPADGGGAAQRGLVVSGSVHVSGSYATASPAAGGGRGGSAEVAFSADIHRGDDGYELTVSMYESGGLGAISELVDVKVAEVDVRTEDTTSGSLELVVPLDDPAVALALISVLVAGSVSKDDLDEIADRADVTVTVQSGTLVAQEGDVEVGAGEVEWAVSTAHMTTEMVLRKPPGGGWYDQERLVDVLDGDLPPAV